MVTFKHSKGPVGQLTSKQKLSTDMEYYRRKSNKDLQKSYFDTFKKIKKLDSPISKAVLKGLNIARISVWPIENLIRDNIEIEKVYKKEKKREKKEKEEKKKKKISKTKKKVSKRL